MIQIFYWLLIKVLCNFFSSSFSITKNNKEKEQETAKEQINKKYLIIIKNTKQGIFDKCFAGLITKLFIAFMIVSM